MKKLILTFLSLTTLVFAGGFENLGVHGRVNALGGAFTGVGDASYTVFYNPAGLINVKQFEISSTYNQLFSGLDDDVYYIAFSSTVPLWKFGEFGAGLTHLKAGSWQENTLIVSYAKDIENFGIGGSFKLLRWSAEAAPGEQSQNYLGFTFDAGIFYSIDKVFGNGIIRLGASAQDISQPSIAINGSNDAKIPMKLSAGISYFSPTYEYLLAIDGIKENENYLIKFGAEFLAMKNKIYGIETGLYLRGGYNGIVNESPYKQNSLNGGFGVFVNKLRIDYAYVSRGYIVGIGNSHIISLTYQF